MRRQYYHIDKGLVPPLAPGDNQQTFAIILFYTKCPGCGNSLPHRKVKYWEDVADPKTGTYDLSKCPPMTKRVQGPHTAETAAECLNGSPSKCTPNDIRKRALASFRSPEL
jgi:hypothetical protein